MHIQWTILHNNDLVPVKLSYNVYTGSKKLYVDEKMILSVRERALNNELTFKHRDKEYKLQLLPEGYGYTGHIVTEENDIVYPNAVAKVSHKTPILALPFVILNMAIPIVSVEAFTPWVIALLSSYITVRFCQRSKLSRIMKPAVSLVISVLAWTAYYVFYLNARKSGMHGGFISFN